jgi:hypothetical protein
MPKGFTKDLESLRGLHDSAANNPVEGFEALKANVSRFCQQTYPALVNIKNTELLKDILISNPLFGAIALGVWLKTLKVENLDPVNPLGQILVWLEGHELSCSIKRDLSMQLKEYLDKNYETLTFEEWNEIRSAVASVRISELTDAFIENTIPRLKHVSTQEKAQLIKQLVAWGKLELIKVLIPSEFRLVCQQRKLLETAVLEAIKIGSDDKNALTWILMNESWQGSFTPKAIKEFVNLEFSVGNEVLQKRLPFLEEFYTEEGRQFDRRNFYKLHIIKEISSHDDSNKISLYVHKDSDKISAKMTKDKQLSVRINLLPTDIKRKIFDDYIRIDYLAIQYKLETKTYESQNLEPEKLLSRWLKMKTIPNLIVYLKINDNIFKRLYHQHYILKDKNFRHMDTDNSFIVSLLFTLYH